MHTVSSPLPCGKVEFSRRFFRQGYDVQGKRVLLDEVVGGTAVVVLRKP